MKKSKAFPFEIARRITAGEVKAARKAIDKKLRVKRSSHNVRPHSTTSKLIKDAGHRAVIRYELERGRIVTEHQRDGFDLLSRGNGEVRHIEVKATAKARFQWRWLTEAEFRAVATDSLFYLYLVTEAGTPKEKVVEMRRDDVLRRFRGTTTLYVISFPKGLEAGDDEEI